MRKNVSLALLLGLCAVGAPIPAWSHALLVKSSPADQASLERAPTEAVLDFNSRIEKKVTQVTLLDSKGAKIPLPPSPDAYSGGTPNSLTIPLPRLGAGEYRLQYRILAVDGHTTPGLIRFRVQGS